MADLRGRLQSGFGSPEGVVYAGTGVTWQDTSPAGSGKLWRKTTPNGNTGWVEVGAGGGGGLSHRFAAYVPSPITGGSHTGPGDIPLIYTTEVLDVASEYNVASGVWTPLSAGWYAFFAWIQISPESMGDYVFGMTQDDHSVPATYFADPHDTRYVTDTHTFTMNLAGVTDFDGSGTNGSRPYVHVPAGGGAGWNRGEFFGWRIDG